MVVDDPDLLGSMVRPAEHDTPLVVDTNGVKASQDALQGFQVVSGRDSQVTEGAGLIQLNQFPQPDPREGGETAASFREKQGSGLFVGERLDHELPSSMALMDAITGPIAAAALARLEIPPGLWYGSEGKCLLRNGFQQG